MLFSISSLYTINVGSWIVCLNFFCKKKGKICLLPNIVAIFSPRYLRYKMLI